MSWGTSKGFNFRSTVDYVTDPTNTVYVARASYVYPTAVTCGGDSITLGWDSATSLQAVNRNAQTGDGARLAGCVSLIANTATRYLRVDLPAAGDYKVRLAIGDYSYAGSHHVRVTDGVGGATLIDVAADTVAS